MGDDQEHHCDSLVRKHDTKSALPSPQSSLAVLVLGSAGKAAQQLVAKLRFGAEAAAAAAAGSPRMLPSGMPARGLVIHDLAGHADKLLELSLLPDVVPVALLHVDAREGEAGATRRDAVLASLLDVRHLVVALDVGDGSAVPHARVAALQSEIESFAVKLGRPAIMIVPVDSAAGGNVTRPAQSMPGYKGPTLIEALAGLEPARPVEQPFRMLVQQVETTPGGQKTIVGTVARGSARPGDAIAVLPEATIATITAVDMHPVHGDGVIGQQLATVVLDSDIEARQGDVVCARADRPEVSDQVAAHIVWLGEQPMLPGRPYDFQCGNQWASGSITSLKYRMDLDLDHLAAKHLSRGEIGFCNIAFSHRIVFEPHSVNGLQGRCTIIDRATRDVVGVGLIRFGLWRATNVHWQALDINKAARAASKGQKPCCLWFTGLSGSGKSTIANLLEKRLHAEGRHTYILDGDNVRHGLNRDLGFTDEDRVENIRRVSEVARLLVDAGLVVMVSFISPFRAERRMARGLVGDKEFVEIFVDTPLAVCEQRDPKGLYKKARQGIIKNFTGIDSSYEPPERPELRLNAASSDPSSLVDEIYSELKRRDLIS